MKKFLFFILIIFIAFLVAFLIFNLNHVNKNISKNTLLNDEVIRNNNEIYSDDTEFVKYTNTPYYFENNTLHGIAIKNTNLYNSIDDDKKIIDEIKYATNVTILNTLDNYYEVAINDKNGYVAKEDVSYYIYDAESKITLGCDVSGFNYDKDFKTKEDFELYILNNKFNYVIIRLGGRGYGQAGNMYYDNRTDFFVEACEYLGVPYGLYFLDEAINEDEIFSEFEFIMDKYKDYNGKFNLLPLAIDIENQHGDGRADNIWEQRVLLVNLLIEKLKSQNVECMIYANGARIETYLKGVNTNYWTAAYTLDNNIPKVFYDEFIENEEEKNRKDVDNINSSILNHKTNLGDTNTIWYSDDYLDRVIAWQFTENAASNDGIEGMLDLNLFKNEYFVLRCYEVFTQK